MNLTSKIFALTLICIHSSQPVTELNRSSTQKLLYAHAALNFGIGFMANFLRKDTTSWEYSNSVGVIGSLALAHTESVKKQLYYACGLSRTTLAPEKYTHKAMMLVGYGAGALAGTACRPILDYVCNFVASTATREKHTDAGVAVRKEIAEVCKELTCNAIAIWSWHWANAHSLCPTWPRVNSTLNYLAYITTYKIAGTLLINTLFKKTILGHVKDDAKKAAIPLEAWLHLLKTINHPQATDKSMISLITHGQKLQVLRIWELLRGMQTHWGDNLSDTINNTREALCTKKLKVGKKCFNLEAFRNVVDACFLYPDALLDLLEEMPKTTQEEMLEKIQKAQKNKPSPLVVLKVLKNARELHGKELPCLVADTSEKLNCYNTELHSNIRLNICEVVTTIAFDPASRHAWRTYLPLGRGIVPYFILIEQFCYLF